MPIAIIGVGCAICAIVLGLHRRYQGLALGMGLLGLALIVVAPKP